jgi:hypothetical protein
VAIGMVFNGHIFAEMPLLGFMGYMPFGILVWAVFIWLGALFGFDTELLRRDVNSKDSR